MRANAYEIIERPEHVYVIQHRADEKEAVETALSRSSLSFCHGKGSRMYIIGAVEEIKNALPGKNVDSEQFSLLAEPQQRFLLYEILDGHFLRWSVKKRGRNSFFFFDSDKKDNNFPPKLIDGTFVHSGFEYKIEMLNEKSFVVVSPNRVFTKDGMNYDPVYAKEVHAKFRDSTAFQTKYRQYAELFEGLTTQFGKAIAVRTENGTLQLMLCSELPSDNLGFIPEPQIDFGGGRRHTFPGAGVKRYHPLDYNLSIKTRPVSIKAAFIGSGLSWKFLAATINGETGGHYPFKGFKEVYKTDLTIGPRKVILKEDEIKSCTSIEDVVSLLLREAATLKNKGLDFDLCIIELPTAWEPFFSKQDVNLRDYIKVKFWSERIPTQIITRKAVDAASSMKLDNLALGIYVTAGGKPWRLEDQFTGTAYVGISFGQFIRTSKKRLIGIAEIFDEYGQSISITSLPVADKPFATYFEDKDFHLSKQQLETIFTILIQEYRQRMDNNLPENVIVHKTSNFNEVEKESFQSLSDSYPVDFSLIYVDGRTSWNFLTENKQEPARGTYWRMTDEKALLCTSGIIDNQQAYFLPGMPYPLVVTKEKSSKFTIDQICKQVMLLTKLNWNSINTYEREPVTIAHSRKLVDLLRAGLKPSDVPRDARFFI